MSTTKTPAELVHAFPFFAGLDEQTYTELLAHGQLRHFAKDETLFHEGESGKGLFLVQSGVIKIYKLSESGREQIIELSRPGDSVAELPLFDHGPYPASAAALEPSAVLFIPKAAFAELLLQRPQLAQAVIIALAQRMRNLVHLIADLSLRQVRQRLARFLVEEAGGRTTFPLTLTNDELASRLGSVRDVISRTLSALQADGLIRLHGRQVEILDADGLRAAVN
ncbi:MAG TPA: Crp/Fnr family transcriptional regulator [Armatimonadota bacterium]|jgi:CRP/FNR family transcriptional regulator